MGQSSGKISKKPALIELASALICMGALVSCGDGETVTVTYTDKDNKQALPPPKKAAREKCYGIALAQYNDCAAGKGTHCAGTAQEDYMPDRWKYVPARQCLSLNGSLLPETPAEPSEK